MRKFKKLDMPGVCLILEEMPAPHGNEKASPEKKHATLFSKYMQSLSAGIVVVLDRWGKVK